MIVVANATEAGGKSIEEMIKEGIKRGQKTTPDLKILEGPKAAEIGQLKGMEVRTEGTIDNEKMESVQIFAMNDKKIYIMTYSCKVGNCKNYYVFQTMVKNFKPK